MVDNIINPFLARVLSRQKWGTVLIIVTDTCRCVCTISEHEYDSVPDNR